MSMGNGMVITNLPRSKVIRETFTTFEQTAMGTFQQSATVISNFEIPRNSIAFNLRFGISANGGTGNVYLIDENNVEILLLAKANGVENLSANFIVGLDSIILNGVAKTAVGFLYGGKLRIKLFSTGSGISGQIVSTKILETQCNLIRG
jgi:hypothetical protein